MKPPPNPHYCHQFPTESISYAVLLYVSSLSALAGSPTCYDTEVVLDINIPPNPRRPSRPQPLPTATSQALYTTPEAEL